MTPVRFAQIGARVSWGLVVWSLALGVLYPAASSAAGVWTAGGALGAVRANHTLTELPGGKVLAVGGTNRETGPIAAVASAELFDPATATWAFTGSLAQARGSHSATLLAGPGCGASCGKVLVTGGSGRSSAELYDPLTGAWSATASMAAVRTGHTATLLPDGRVLVAGGIGTSGAVATAELYDAAAGTWSPAGAMATARSTHTATLLSDGRVLVVAGRGANLSEVQSAELYDPAANQWAPAGSLVVPRAFHSATLLTDGRVLVAGGRGGSPIAPRRSAEIFDPATGPIGSWSTTGSTDDGHSSHLAARLPDGTVVIAGGSSPQRAEILTSERYDPVTATWRYSGSMKLARGFMGSLLLSGPGCAARCGQVLAAGGSRQSSEFVDATELFDAAAPTAPGRVGDLSASAGSASVITLSFSAPPSVESFPPPAARYAIRQAAEPILDAAAFDRATPLCGGVCTLGPAAIGDRLTVDVTDLAPGSTHHFALRALDEGNGVGELSNSAVATTAGAAPPPPVPAGAISDLRARALSARSVELSFAAPAAGGATAQPATEYEIRQATAPIADAAGYDRAMVLCGALCTFAPPASGARLALSVTRLEPNTTYRYAIRARESDGRLGTRSNVATVRTRRDRIAPGRVRFLRPRVLRMRAALRLGAVASDGAKGPPVRRYMVKQASRPVISASRWLRAAPLCPKGGCRFAPKRVGQVLVLNVTRLRPGRTYHFAVRAQDGAGNWSKRSLPLRVRTAR